MKKLLPQMAACAADIRDIRGPLPVPDPWQWLYYAGAALILALACVVLWRMLKRRRKIREKAAHEWAMEELERARGLMREGSCREFSFAVSGALRTYIQMRFSIMAGQCTTREFLWLVAADRTGPLSGYKDLLDDFLAHCDLAKFARYRLCLEEMERMHESARHFVERTIDYA